MGEIWFVTGGARSGKSRFAQRLAESTGSPVTFLATLEPLDEEMRDRIARHRAERDAGWQTIETPRDIVAAFREIDGASCALIDCLSGWVSNRLLAVAGDDPSPDEVEVLESGLLQALGSLLDAADARAGHTIVVSNEVGDGVVPPTPLGRAYRDLLGRANQLASRRARRAWLVVAGRALPLPDAPPDE